jgi:hypothetical protein
LGGYLQLGGDRSADGGLKSLNTLCLGGIVFTRQRLLEFGDGNSGLDAAVHQKLHVMNASWRKAE